VRLVLSLKKLQNQSHQKEVRMAKVILRGLVPDDSPIYQQGLQIGGRLTVPTQKAAEPILKKTTVRPKKM